MKKQWWHDKVAYQIYPKSFYDSNGDGIGDIPGIISKLDYLKELGVDIVWISPIYKSPLADQGYDISDYYGINPQFGTMEDMELLIAEAKARDMYILMDLVVNHCSDEHEWFQKAIQDPDGEYGKYFYILPREEGKVPCNWRSEFGGSVWEPLPGHPDKQYFHTFHKKQPDLNWENPKVREEVYKNIRWWMDKGLSGFRVDAIINIKKAPFADYPPDREDGTCISDRMLEDAHGVGDFLGEMAREAFLPKDAFTVGEVFNGKDEDLPNFIGEDGYFSTMFDFDGTGYGKSLRGWYDCKQQLTPEELKSCMFEAQRKVGDIGMVSNIIENHDEPRGVSHYIQSEDLCDDAKKLLGGVRIMLKGLPFLYQGQEIGMENLPFSDIKEVDDCSTLGEYKRCKEVGFSDEEALKAVGHFSRDNARSPVQWTSGENAGFTTGTPWLRLNPNYVHINVETQKNDPNSVWNFYKKLLALRKHPKYKETVVYGTWSPYLEEERNLIAFMRTADKKLLVAANFQNEAREILLPGKWKNVLLNNKDILDASATTVMLNAYQFIVLEIE